MKFFDFVKDKLVFIFSQIFIVFFISLLFKVHKISNQATILVSIFIIITLMFALIYEYIKKMTYDNRLYDSFNKLDKKQYIAEFLEEPEFLEAEILYDILKQSSKAMNDEIATQKIVQKEYKEYIETWIHEIKLPISCIDLICKNNANEITKSISEEVARIDSFIEQALFYARSSMLETDYIIKSLNIEDMVKSTIKKHSKQLIASKAKFEFENLNCTVYADLKWMDFILGQIISNSIKYRKEEFKLSFSAFENDTQVILKIQDNGIGIPDKDLKKVFEKGFTGENGRSFGKSTGIGLYLCKKMCNKMNLNIDIKSEVGKGTCIYILFPKDKSIIFD